MNHEILNANPGRISIGKVVVMGVCGAGKTTIAQQLASHFQGCYLDADNYHPPENIQKMASGISLNDEDRGPWLQSLAKLIEQHSVNDDGPLFLACSALKQSYRDILRTGDPSLHFLCLTGSRDVLWNRLTNRQHSFMPPSQLDNQLATLEIPHDEIVVDIDQPLESLIDQCVQGIIALNENER